MAQRIAVRAMQASFGLSERRACGLVGVDRATCRYQGRRADWPALRERLRGLAAERRRFGYRRLHVLLRREGYRVNLKRVYRLYREEGLAVRRRRRRRRVARGTPLAVPARINERWSLDFLLDTLEDGRRVRLLAVVDDFTRACLAIEVDTSIGGRRVVEVLQRLVEARGKPGVLITDNVLSARGWSSAGTQHSSGGSGSRDSVRQQRTQSTQRSSASEKDPAAHSEHRVRARAGLALTALNTA
ncbi:MAG TPA: IS3 family transposase [Myxococcales bacterium]|nr:IS3 family transposase [Myxococcales bacterium]